MYSLYRLAGFKRLLFIVLMAFSMKLYAANLPNELLNIPIPLISGEETSLARYDGKKPVYLKFWATWCQPCRKEMPHFEHIQKQYGEMIEVIGINLGINDDLNVVKKTIQEFALTMPIAIDYDGNLAQAFRMIGTPYHLLFDRNMNLIHQGHEANKSLDNKLALVSQSNNVDLLDVGLLSENEHDIELQMDDGKTYALFFTSTWCDWYLNDSRPDIAKNCIAAQQQVNVLHQKYPNIVWRGAISRLWTANKDLLEYVQKYSITYPLEIDYSNRLFHRFLVKNLPTLILVKDNKIIFKTSKVHDNKPLVKLLIASNINEENLDL